MTIGPQTEAGPAVVPQRPTTEAERLEWLVRLCEGLVMSPSGWTTSKLRDALAPAARTWTADALGVSAAERESERETRDDLIEALERLNECRQALGLPAGTTGEVLVMEVRAMAGRIAQLEEALAAAGREANDLRVALSAERDDRAAEQQRHAVEQGRRRRTIRALAAELVAEMERGGGV